MRIPRGLDDLLPPLPVGADLPPGEIIELAGRGPAWCAHLPGPAGAPTLVLLHGLGCSGYITWYGSIPALNARYSLLVPDLRWHARGVSTGRHFRLEDAADDVALLASAYGVDRFVPTGYSMGGAVAQMLWHRHADRVDGLILGGTAARFTGLAQEGLLALATAQVGVGAGLLRSGHRAGLGRLTRRPAGLVAPPGSRAAAAEVRRWVLRDYARTPVSAQVAASIALSRFDSRAWLPAVDVPTAVLVNIRDKTVPTQRQRELAALLPQSSVIEVDWAHTACILGCEVFTPAVVAAAGRVTAPAAVAA